MSIPLDPRTHARSADPDTSHQAAHQLSDRTVMLRKLLTAFAAEAMTADEAGARCGYTAADGAWKRMSDLERLGLIEDSGQRRKGTAGRQQKVRRITDAGHAALGTNAEPGLW